MNLSDRDLQALTHVAWSGAYKDEPRQMTRLRDAASVDDVGRVLQLASALTGTMLTRTPTVLRCANKDCEFCVFIGTYVGRVSVERMWHSDTEEHNHPHHPRDACYALCQTVDASDAFMHRFKATVGSAEWLVAQGRREQQEALDEARAKLTAAMGAMTATPEDVRKCERALAALEE